MRMIFPRYAFCLVLCLIVLGSACAHKERGHKASSADLVIFHINDTHSYMAGIDNDANACTEDSTCTGGFARISQAIKEARKRGENVLALDAGDMFTGTLFSTLHGWPLQSKINSLLPLDGATLGNHEWDYGCETLADYLAEKRPFPILAANLSPKTGCPLQRSDIQPSLVKTIGGHKVGVIGLASDYALTNARACPQTNFTPRIESIEKEVRTLEAEGINRIVLLTHIGLDEDRDLARKINGVDVIVGGHSHSYLGPNSKEGSYPIVEHSPNGDPVLIVTAKRATEYLGRLACTFNEKGVLTKWSGKAIRLTPDFPRDPALASLLTSYSKEIEKELAEKISHHTLDYGPDGLSACRENECLTAMVMTDAMLAHGRTFGAEIALLNSGNVRAALPRDISRGHVLTAFPFKTKIIVREFTGKEIKEALEHGVSQKNARGRYMLQTAGLRYTVDGTKEVGKRVIQAEVIDKYGQSRPLRPKKRYRVVITDYLEQGGDSYTMLKKGRVISRTESDQALVLENYLLRNNPLSAPTRGRIIRKDPQI